MYYAVAFLGVVSLFLYWAYKKMREAPYKPGMVAEMAKIDDFDDVALHKECSKDKWRLPGNVDIYYFPPRLDSSDQPPVLAIHGGPAISPKETWKLADTIPNLYLYHARGCGYSSRPLTAFPTPGMWPGIKLLEQQLGIGTQVADMERIRRRLGVEKIDLVGHSFGGFTATLYAAEFPQHVRSLTLLLPAAVLVLPSKDGDLFTMVEAKLEERGNQEHLDEFKAFMKLYLDFGSLPKETEESLALRQAGFAKHYYRAVEGVDEPTKPPVDSKMIGGMACYATFLSMGMEHDYVPALKERLSGADFPVSLVHGVKDFIPESTSRKYIDLFPAGQVKFHTIEDGDHDLFDLEEVGSIVKNTIHLASKDT